MSRLVSGALKSLPTIIGNCLSWINRNSKGKKPKDPITIRFRKLKNLVLKVSKNLKIEYHVEGLENIPQDGVYALFPNHMAAFDPLAIIQALNKPTTFVSKDSNRKIPVVGKIVTAMDGLYIDRSNLKQTVDAMLHIEKDLKEQNKNWIIFPEGTRNRFIHGPLLEFHRGIFRAVMKAEVPIVPIAMFGTHKALSKKEPLKKYPIYVRFLKPIMPNEYAERNPEEVAVDCRSEMQVVVDELRAKYFKEIENLFLKKKDLESFLNKKLD